MTKTHRTNDGIKLTTGSNRRWVTFGVDGYDGKPYVIKRTDSYDTALKNHELWASRLRGSRRVITVDYGYTARNRFNEIETIPSSVLADTIETFDADRR